MLCTISAATEWNVIDILNKMYQEHIFSQTNGRQFHLFTTRLPSICSQEVLKACCCFMDVTCEDALRNGKWPTSTMLEIPESVFHPHKPPSFCTSETVTEFITEHVETVKLKWQSLFPANSARDSPTRDNTICIENVARENVAHENVAHDNHMKISRAFKPVKKRCMQTLTFHDFFARRKAQRVSN